MPICATSICRLAFNASVSAAAAKRTAVSAFQATALPQYAHASWLPRLCRRMIYTCSRRPGTYPSRFPGQNSASVPKLLVSPLVASRAKSQNQGYVNVLASECGAAPGALFLKRCAAYPFGRDPRTFEKRGHHSRLLPLSLDDIYWHGNADSRCRTSTICPEAEAPYVFNCVRAIIATIGNRFLRLDCPR